MERMDYPNSGDEKSTEQQLKAIRGFLNEFVDVVNHNFEQIENAVNEIMEKVGED